MAEVAGSIWWLIVALGLLVTFHEFGHFWVARRFGVRVLRFSVGFGSALYKRRGRDGTEYVIAALPLGGYVKMLDEREGNVPADQADRAFNRKPLLARTAIIAAGPVFNLFFALFAFWLMFMVGVQEFRMILGPTTGVAAESGLKSGDEIVAVGERPTQTLTHASIELLGYALDREPAPVTVADSAGLERRLTLDFTRLPADFDQERFLAASGLNLYQPQGRPFVDRLIDGEPAQRAGLLPGDLIVSVNGDPVPRARDLTEVIQTHGGSGKPLDFLIRRGGDELLIPITPEQTRDSGQIRYVIGVYPFDPADRRFFTIFRYGPLASVGAALSESRRITVATLGLIGRMVTGDASLKNLSGPISIAQFARDSARLGLSRFLFFLGVLSLSLAILNFLPIPLLDGGHLLYNLIEFITGHPVSERVQIVGQYVGLSVLIALMSLTFYNDILRLVS